MPNRVGAFLLLIAAALALPPKAHATAKPPLVLAAASLQEALSEAAASYTAAGHPRPVISFAASSALARQISVGAPADIFISADEEWMDFVGKQGLLRKSSRASFLTNRLVLIAPARQPLRLRIAPRFALAAALGSGRLAMADPAAVPAGKYGRAALIRLGVWRAVQPKIVAAENVRSALLLVSRGEARAGIVYATDARSSRDIAVAGMFPTASHPSITYPLAILARSRNPEAARFRQFLLSPRAAAIFRKYGFGMRSPSPSQRR